MCRDEEEQDGWSVYASVDVWLESLVEWLAVSDGSVRGELVAWSMMCAAQHALLSVAPWPSEQNSQRRLEHPAKSVIPTLSNGATLRRRLERAAAATGASVDELERDCRRQFDEQLHRIFADTRTFEVSSDSGASDIDLYLAVRAVEHVRRVGLEVQLDDAPNMDPCISVGEELLFDVFFREGQESLCFTMLQNYGAWRGLDAHFQHNLEFMRAFHARMCVPR